MNELTTNDLEMVNGGVINFVAHWGIGYSMSKAFDTYFE